MMYFAPLCWVLVLCCLCCSGLRGRCFGFDTGGTFRYVAVWYAFGGAVWVVSVVGLNVVPVLDEGFNMYYL